MLASPADTTFAPMRSSSLVVSMGAHAVAIGLAVFLTAKPGDSRQTPPERAPILIYRVAPVEPTPVHPGVGSGTTSGRPTGLRAPTITPPGIPPIDAPPLGGPGPVTGVRQEFSFALTR